MSGQPQLWVFAGPNGAGKSTLAARFVKERLPIVNPDAIALELRRRDDGSLNQLDAGRLALERRYERSMRNLEEAAGLADQVIVFDNSGDRHRLVLVDEGGVVRWHAELPGWLDGLRYGRERP